MTALNWLHLTDWHIGQKDEGLWPNVKDLFLKDLRRLARAQKQAFGEPWDVVLFTGDLAFSGKESQYKQLTAELEQIWKVFREEWPEEKEPVLLCVPGNHDLDRSKAVPTIGAMRDSKDLRKWLFSGDPQILSVVESPFAEYTKWWEGCPLRPQNGVQKGLLPGEFSYVLEKDGIQFGFVGLNSSFLDVDDDSNRKLWLDVQQLHKSCGGSAPDFFNENTLSFLLTHHPPDWLSPEAQTHYKGEIAIGERFVAHICGHLHEAFAQEHRQGFGKEHRLLQGVSLFGLEKLPGKDVSRKHGYTAGRLVIDDNGQALLTLWPRLAVKLQDGSWRLTADYTYELEDDLSHTPTRALERRIQRREGSAKVPEAPPVEVVSGPRTWREAAEDATLWKTASGHAAALKPLRQLAGEMAEVCWKTWGEADVALAEDPWRDDQYPLRVLERLERFVGNQPGCLSPVEVLALVLAPFVREAVRSCGVQWMVGVEPERLTYTSASTEPRNTLEQSHLARPDLVRRAERLAGPERRSLVLWMMHRAFDRMGALWNPPPWPTGLRQLEFSLGGLMKRRGAAGLTWSRLTTLSRCIGAGLDLLEAEEGPAREPIEEVLEGGFRMRRAALAYLLCAAGWSALDPSLADEVAVDHVGIESSFRVEELRQAFREAHWEQREKEEVLSLLCHQPVIDFVLKELVARADEVLAQVRHKAAGNTGETLAPLRRLPSRMSAAEVQPASDEHGSLLYRPRHVRFRLDHDRIRELLMGEQLYRDPTLALRELYQNALDACRYRRARQEFLRRDKGDPSQYVGLISFRQGVEGGRPFIECTDNGIGMSEYDLERVFAVAGRRFVHTPEYIEERAAWSKLSPPIELHPNSQFGIGVLSYFMLADELQVTTRRFQRDGRLGLLLNARISSASGLFRLTEQESSELPDGGTRVRLYLGQRRELSAREILGRLLQVAEFRTEVQDELGTVLVWEPSALSRGADHLVIDDAGVWLSAEGGEGGVLVDGIVTDTALPLVTINLHGKRYPRLSVDRRHILSWSRDWLEHVLENGIERVAKWPGLSLKLLWALEEHYPKIASRIFKLLVDLDAMVPLEYQSAVKIAVKYVGCFFWDDYFVAERLRRKRILFGKDRFSMNSIERWRIGIMEKAGLLKTRKLLPLARAEEVAHLLAAPGDTLLMCVVEDMGVPGGRVGYRKRLTFRGARISFVELLSSALLQGYTFDDLCDRLECYRPLGVEIEISLRGEDARRLMMGIRAEDLKILSSNLDGRGPWLEGAVNALHVLHAARKLDHSLQKVARRLSELAPLLELQLEFKPEALDGLELEEEDWQLILDGLGASDLRFEGTVSVLDVLGAARGLDRLPQEVARRLSELAPLLGLQLGFKPEMLDGLELEEEDWQLILDGLGASDLWFEDTVHVFHVLGAARDLDRLPQEVARRLSELAPLLGLQLGFKPEMLDGLELEEEDWQLILGGLGASDLWFEGTVSVLDVIGAARELDRLPQEVVRRLSELSPFLGLQLGFKPEVLDGLGLEEEDWQLLSEHVDGSTPLLEGTVYAQHVIRAASELGRSHQDVASRLSELAPMTGLRLGFVPEAFSTPALEEADPQELTVLAGIFVTARGDNANVMAEARFHLWWLTDAQIEQLLFILRPLLDAELTDQSLQGV
ncbi:metallophosphoesterase [Archangium gephyra]|uniref:wHTH domain-containing protein n=2 Tax=Archangium gephyra TaxID=48 RepID=UPI00147148AD|nr:metallophosphoesterase [Archangium gephyra]